MGPLSRGGRRAFVSCLCVPLRGGCPWGRFHVVVLVIESHILSCCIFIEWWRRLCGLSCLVALALRRTRGRRICVVWSHVHWARTVSVRIPAAGVGRLDQQNPKGDGSEGDRGSQVVRGIKWFL